MPGQGRAMLQNAMTLQPVPVDDGSSLASMLHMGAMNQRMQMEQAHQQQQLALQQQQLQQKAQHELFGDLYTLGTSPHLEGNTAAQDQIFSALGQIAGIGNMSTEDMQRSREQQKQLYKTIQTGNADETTDALAQLGVTVSAPYLQKMVDTFSQVPKVKEQLLALQASRNLNEEKFNQLTDAQMKVNVGRSFYPQASLDFKNALQPTQSKPFTDAMSTIQKMTPKGMDDTSKIENTFGGKALPQLLGQQGQALQESAYQKRMQYQQLANVSQQMLNADESGAQGLTNAEKYSLQHRMSAATDLADAYQKLGDWAATPFNKSKLQAAQQAGKDIDAKRLALDKMQTDNNAMAVQLRQDALSFRQSEAGQKQLYQSTLGDAQSEFAGLPATQQTPQMAAQLQQRYKASSGVSLLTKDIMEGVANPNKPLVENKIDMRAETEYSKQFAQNMAKSDVDMLDVARKAPDLIDRSHRIQDALNSGGVITGAGAEFRLQAAKAFKLAGLTTGEDIANTETLAADLAHGTLDAIKSSGLGSGTGFSNADRDFLEKVVGGKITLEKQSLMRLAQLSERAATKSVDKWNSRVKAIPESALAGTGITRDPIQIQPRQAAKQAQPQSGQSLKSLPQGSKQIGTSNGKPVYQSPDGKRWMGE